MNLFIILLFLCQHAIAQVNTPSCNSACINYLTALTNEKNIVNAAVWDYSGPVNADQIHTVCTLAVPLSCCDCGGIGLDSNELLMLDRWAVTCNTFNSVQDGGVSAVTCWTGHFGPGQGCVDYEGLLEGGTCASPSAGGGAESSSVAVVTSTSALSTQPSMVVSSSSLAIVSSGSQTPSVVATTSSSNSGSVSTSSSAGSSPTSSTTAHSGAMKGHSLDKFNSKQMILTLLSTVLLGFVW